MTQQTVTKVNHHINQAKAILIDERIAELRAEISALETELESKKREITTEIISCLLSR